MPAHRTIAIVGAGFSGTVVAANLLRCQHWGPTRIVLIERTGTLGRGKAYADRDPSFILNVPAGRMSADSAAPLDFLSFAQRRIPEATAEDFLPRSLYGQYLESILLGAEVSAQPHVQFERVTGDVREIESRPSTYRLHLTDGRVLESGDVVLALGNPPPTPLPGTDHLGQGYIADPWAQPLQFKPDETVLLVGTGLTMADVAIAAASSSNEQAHIHSISRHGLIPPSQTQFSHSTCKGDCAALLRAASFSARTLVQKVRELAEQTQQRGGDWREAVTFIRNIAPALWQRLPARERRRLLRHVRPYWDVHRHRLPSETLARLNQLQQWNKLHFHAGRLLSFENVGARIQVTWRARGTETAQTMLVDRVVNCTGPDYNIQRSRDPLVCSLISQHFATSDPLNLGIRTGAFGALIGTDGRPVPNLFYVGPMLRADHWEATAVPELRGHAERLAAYLSAPVGRMRTVAGA